MKQSFTFYITLLVLKLKGLKKEFSKDPIDFKKIRKEDIHQPKGKFFKSNQIRNFKIHNTTITEIGQNETSDKLLIFIHGGAFISGPARHHWDAARQFSLHTGQTVWMVDYPKAPETKISEISKNIDLIYKAALDKHPSKNITLIGDSAGGTLVAALIQRVIEKNLDLPNKIFLISPVMDASMTNPEIDKIDLKDPMLSVVGVRSAKTMCAEKDDLKNPMISPLHGRFDQFPHTILFVAENDITYPDQQLSIQKLLKANVETEVIIGKNMPHIWPFLPVMKEAKYALNQIIDRINN